MSSIDEITKNTTRGLSQIKDDLHAMRNHLLSPLTEVQNLSWLQDRAFLLVCAFGLVPLISIIIFANRGDLQMAYWALAIYFSCFWGLFFYSQFSPKKVNRNYAITSFCVTAFLSISVLVYLLGLPPLSWIRHGIVTNNDLYSTLSYIFGVGFPEELCKLGVVYWIFKRIKAEQPSSDLLMFYGLMSGLGFGIYEGVEYQTGYNTYFSSSAAYLLNVLRLTSLPFLHAVWTAIAAYYLSLTLKYERRKKGLLVLAVAVPGLLHGLYDQLGSSIAGLLVAFFSVYLMNYYRTRAIHVAQEDATGASQGTP